MMDSGDGEDAPFRRQLCCCDELLTAVICLIFSAVQWSKNVARLSLLPQSIGSMVSIACWKAMV